MVRKPEYINADSGITSETVMLYVKMLFQNENPYKIQIHFKKFPERSKFTRYF